MALNSCYRRFRDCTGSDSVGGGNSETAGIIETAEKPRFRLLLGNFALIEDDREACRMAHSLPEVLSLVVCGTIAAGDDFTNIADRGEDKARGRTGHGPTNMAVVRHFALNPIRVVDDRRSIKLRRKRAARNNQYLAQILQPLQS